MYTNEFSVGYDDGSGSGVQPCYKVAVNSQAVNLSGALLGDVNGDGVVDIFDVTALFDLTFETLTPEQIAVADVNGDKEVDIFDVTACFDLCFS